MQSTINLVILELSWKFDSFLASQFVWIVFVLVSRLKNDSFWVSAQNIYPFFKKKILNISRMLLVTFIYCLWFYFQVIYNILHVTY